MARNYNDASAPKCFSEAVRKVWINAVAAGILSIIIYVSLGVVFKTVAPNHIGYQPVTNTKQGIREADGDPVFFKNNEIKFPDSDYDVIYGVSPVQEVVSQVLMAALVGIMIYSVMWAYGDHQRNSVGIGRAVRDKFEGIKIGAVSSVFSIVSWLFLLVSKILYDTSLYANNLIPMAMLCVGVSFLSFIPLIKPFVTIANVTMFGKDPALFDIFSNCENISWTGIFILLIPIIYKILVCYLAYELGYKQISIKEKIIYKNNNRS